MRITIEKMSPNDKKGVLELFHKTADYHYSIDDSYRTGEEQEEGAVEHLDELLSNGSLALVAKDGDNVIGMLIAKISEAKKPLKQGKFGFLSKAFVEKEYRGQGVMRKLFEKTLEWLKANNIEEVKLEVNSKNEIGLKTWESFGFTETKKIMKRKI